MRDVFWVAGIFLAILLLMVIGTAIEVLVLAKSKLKSVDNHKYSGKTNINKPTHEWAECNSFTFLGSISSLTHFGNFNLGKI